MRTVVRWHCALVALCAWAALAGAGEGATGGPPGVGGEAASPAAAPASSDPAPSPLCPAGIPPARTHITLVVGPARIQRATDGAAAMTTGAPTIRSVEVIVWLVCR